MDKSPDVEIDLTKSKIISNTLWSGITKADWETLLKGARSVSFQKGDYIIKQGDISPTLYQVCRGKCKVAKEPSDVEENILAYLDETNGIFGEISFLEGIEAPFSASVLADTDDVTVQVIEAYFLQTIFQLFPGLAGRLFQYMSVVLYNRIQENCTI